MAPFFIFINLNVRLYFLKIKKNKELKFKKISKVDNYSLVTLTAFIPRIPFSNSKETLSFSTI